MGFGARTYNGFIDALGGTIGDLARRRFEKRPLGFPFFSQALALVPFVFGSKFRRAIYARLLDGVGTNVVIHGGSVIDDQRTRFGKEVWVSAGCFIDYAIIEDYVLIGQHVVLLAGKGHHNTTRTDIPIKLQGNPLKEPINIGRGAWIGANATVMADVGNDAIVGAGSVVTKPVPPFAVVAGNPAKLVRMREAATFDSGFASIEACVE